MAGLNFDVLLVICRFITDVSTVLSFSLTCSTLRPVAIERRVSMRPVAIDQTSSLCDLYNFIFVDEKTRSPHIHTITIEERNPGSSLTQATSSEGDIDCMVAILASATHMRMLFLHVQRPYGPSPLLQYPRFLSAVSDITSLKELGIAASLVVANKIIGNICSPLTTLQYIESPRLAGPPLCRSATLGFYAQTVQLPYSWLLMAADASLSLPAVRSATVTFWDTHHLRLLRILFTVVPNLDHTLILHDRIPYSQLRGHWDVRPFQALLDDNREAQKTHSWAAVD